MPVVTTVTTGAPFLDGHHLRVMANNGRLMSGAVGVNALGFRVAYDGGFASSYAAADPSLLCRAEGLLQIVDKTEGAHLQLHVSRRAKGPSRGSATRGTVAPR